MEPSDSKKPLRVLMLEDTASDAELMERELRKADIAFTEKRVDKREAFIQALDEFRPDIVLSDYHLPDFDGLSALNIVTKDYPEIPVIMVTGALPDIEAVELIHAGAKDYVLKDRLARLAPAVQRVLSAEQVQRARKAAEQALRESQQRYSQLFNSGNDAVFVHEVGDAAPQHFLEVNDVACQRLGYSREELLSLSPQHIDLPEMAGSRDEALRELNASGRAVFEMIHVAKDGRRIPVEISAHVFDLGGKPTCLSIARDITERKKAEAELLRLNRALKALSAGNHALVRSRDEKELMQGMCQAVTDSDIYKLAWVGWAYQDENKSIRPVAAAGEGQKYVDELHLTWDDQPLGQGPTGAAVRTGQIQIVQDIANDPRMKPWREAAAKHGLASSIALPLRENGQVSGALTLYSDETGAFDAKGVTLLEEMAEDLAFGLAALRTRNERDRALAERQQSADKLRSGLEDTLLAISATLEMRDPYTAGHQRRVALLATAIAREMGLPEEQIHGIHLAGIVHDVGKIHIPAEILSKPGTLTDIEFTFIKIHPQAGYDILKGIEFPWPISQAVLQHHERLNGSGYPQRLAPEQILLEAKILAVADVVEAMSSHRPYRPSLGEEAAFDEIKKNRGVLYDPKVVDSCLALFKNKKFSFE